MFFAKFKPNLFSGFFQNAATFQSLPEVPRRYQGIGTSSGGGCMRPDVSFFNLQLRSACRPLSATFGTRERTHCTPDRCGAAQTQESATRPAETTPRACAPKWKTFARPAARQAARARLSFPADPVHPLGQMLPFVAKIEAFIPTVGTLLAGP